MINSEITKGIKICFVFNIDAPESKVMLCFLNMLDIAQTMVPMTNKAKTSMFGFIQNAPIMSLCNSKRQALVIPQPGHGMPNRILVGHKVMSMFRKYSSTTQTIPAIVTTVSVILSVFVIYTKAINFSKFFSLAVFIIRK